MTRRGAVGPVLAGVLVVLAASAAAWALAYPDGSVLATVLRAVCDGAAILTLGLAVAPLLDDDRHRGELLDRATVPLIVAAAGWLLAEVSRLLVAAADVAGVPFVRLDVSAVLSYASGLGRPAVLGVAAAGVSLVTALVSRGSRARGSANAVVVGAAAIGVVSRVLTGHFSVSGLGGAAVAVHVLAAALWCGALAGLVLTVAHRGRWARVLPRFSTLSLWCVAARVGAGAVGAVDRLGSVADLVVTGYGRVLTAKLVLTSLLVVLGWRNRTLWLPAARGHRASAALSRTRAVVELTAMGVALTLAAGLAVTG